MNVFASYAHSPQKKEVLMLLVPEGTARNENDTTITNSQKYASSMLVRVSDNRV